MLMLLKLLGHIVPRFKAFNYGIGALSRQEGWYLEKVHFTCYGG